MFICWKKWFTPLKLLYSWYRKTCAVIGRPSLFFLSQKKINCCTRQWWKTKSKKSAKWITTVQCTVYTETTWNDFAESHQLHTKSHQLRTMNARRHTNFVQWMNAVTLTPYREWMRGHTNSVPWMHTVCRFRQATFILTNWVHSCYGVGVTAFIHGMEFMQFG